MDGIELHKRPEWNTIEERIEQEAPVRSLLFSILAMTSPSFALQSAIVCTLVLYVKFFVTTMIGAKKREAAGLRAPEDTPDQKQNFGLVTDHMTDQTSSSVLLEEKRWSRIQANDLENLPWGLLAVWSSILCGGDADVTGVSILVFTVARVAHTGFYALAWSKPRSVAYLLGVISIFVLISTGISAAFKK
jgi:uncharacterized MAPEG superfamily protein